MNPLSLRNPRANLSGLMTWVCALLVGSSLCWASIEKLNLSQMVQRVDNAIHGEILAVDVSSVSLPDGGGELFFTTLTLRGNSLLNGAVSTVQVSYPGGFVNDKRGVFNSEAPSADDVRIGNRVIAFYKWSANMGGGFASNGLYASHGGLFRTFVTRKGQTVVQGRGPGYAVATNQFLPDLEKRTRELYEARKR